MNQIDRSDFDPQVDLHIKWVLITQVVIELRSQLNILPRTTWIKLSRPKLVKSDFYLKLANQGLVELLGIWKNVKTTIMGILTRLKFWVIEPKSGSNSYRSLVG